MVRRITTALLLLLVATAASACMVPAARYDEARSALKVEQEANRRGGARLYSVEEQLVTLKAELDQRQRQLDQRGRQIAEAQLDKNVATKQREDASELVDQLRGELARVGDNLRSFAAQKQKLADALDTAEARAKRLQEVEHEAAGRAMIVRDLSLLLHDPLSTGVIELAMTADGRPALRIESARVFGDKGILPQGQQVLSAVVRVSQLHHGSSVTIRERNRDAALTDEQETLRLRRLSDALVAQGLGSERVTLDAGGAEPQTSTGTHDSAAKPTAAGSSGGTPTLEIEIATGASA